MYHINNEILENELPVEQKYLEIHICSVEILSVI